MLRRNFVIGLNAFAFGVISGLLVFPSARRLLSVPGGDGPTGIAAVGGPFSLVDQTGRRVTDRSLQGRPMLVLFGYSRSADLVPAMLQTIGVALQRLGRAADRIVPVFITLDPQHDTPEVLRSYVARFWPGLIALTGTVGEIDAVAKAYKVHYQRSTNSDASNGSLVEHTNLLYLMDGGGNFITFMTYDTSVDAMEQEFRRLL